MNHKSLSALILLGFISSIYADQAVTPTIINRSQGRDAALKVAGLSKKVHLYDEGKYVNLDATLGYQRSFQSDRLAECLFGNDAIDCNGSSIIKVQGSNVADRNANAWLADYFYLPPDYDASFCIEPRIQTALVNLDLYVGLDEWVEGMYFRVHGPLTWSRWNLNFNEKCDLEFSGSFREGYFTPSGLTNDELLRSFGDYALGDAPFNTSAITSNNAEFSPSNIIGKGVAFQGLHYAKMEHCSRQRTGFADLRFELGYNFLQDDDYQVGVNLQVAAPTGSRRDAEFAFDPTIGNGNHWEVGGGLTAHYILWRAQADDKFFGLYLDANLTHINNGRERRTFDLCGRPNSRYMLAQKMGTPVNFLRAGDTFNSAGNTTVPVKQFDGEFAPVANLTTIDVHVRSAIQADIALMANYTANNWGFDVGYNVWARSCEKIDLPDKQTSDCCPSLCSIEKDSWALKGDAAVYGFMSANDTTVTLGSGNLAENDPVALSATQCGATIHKGTNAGVDVADCIGDDERQNCGIDNPKFAFGRGTNSNSSDQFLKIDPDAGAGEGNAIKTSLEPKFINCCDINLQRTKGISHKVFANVNYTWDLEGWDPYFGVGFAAEFASHSGEDCVDTTPDCDACDTTACEPRCCTDCLKCAVSQWHVWLKGGVSFN